MVGRIGLRLFQGLALGIALGSGLAILTSAWIMYKYDIRLLGVQTGSMQPAIQVGDGLISRPVNFTELRAGEIVNYQTANGSTVSHRILSVDFQRKQLLTKGDNNAEPDGQVASSQVLSQPVVIVPYAGKLITVLQKPAGLIGLVYLPASLILTREIVRFNSERRRYYRLVQPPSWLRALNSKT